jgi:hypothetical protein
MSNYCHRQRPAWRLPLTRRENGLGKSLESLRQLEPLGGRRCTVVTCYLTIVIVLLEASCRAFTRPVYMVVKVFFREWNHFSMRLT